MTMHRKCSDKYALECCRVISSQSGSTEELNKGDTKKLSFNVHCLRAFVLLASLYHRIGPVEMERVKHPMTLGVIAYKQSG